jgi:uncharacterized protein (TIGR03790 family)
VLVVVNDRSSESLEVAHYYMHRRAVPRHQLVHLQLPKPQWTQLKSYRDYLRLLEEPVKSWIAANPASPITTIVLSRHVPVATPLEKEKGETRDPWRSTTHMLAVMHAQFPQGKTAEALAIATVRNPLATETRSVDPRRPARVDFPVYCVGVVNASDVADAKALVDRAIASEQERPKGTVYLVGSKKGDPRGLYNSSFPQLQASLERGGFPAEIVPFAGSSLLEGKQDVLVLQFGNANWDPTFPAKNRYVPGALVDNLTSVALTARHFVKSPKGGQTGMTYFTAAGASAIHGCVKEPYTAAFDGRHRHITRYLAGFSLLESYYQSHPLLPWMNLVAADPLMQPFAQRPLIRELSFTSEGNTSLLSVKAKATRRNAGIARLVCYVNGVHLASHEGDEATFTLEGFDSAVDRAVVVAVDDTAFATQGRLVKEPPFASATARLEFRKGQVRVQLSRRVPFSWYAPRASEPRGTRLGDSLALRAAGGSVAIWVHADPSGPPSVFHLDLDAAQTDRALAEGTMAAKKNDMSKLADAVAALQGIPLDPDQKKKVAGWIQRIEPLVEAQWKKLKKRRLPRDPKPKHLMRLEAFVERYSTFPSAEEARAKLAQVYATANERALPVWKAALALEEQSDWTAALKKFKLIASRWGISEYGDQATERVRKIKAREGD